MKRFSMAAALAVLVLPVFAGDGLSGYRCDNMCPLATTANSHRSYGLEAVQASKVARADVTARVEANLQKV